MRFVKFLISSIALFLLLTSVTFASGYEVFGLGTTARAMGGAFRAVADDWTAAYYNPAGYAYIYDNQLGANLSIWHPRYELIPNYRWNGVYETGIFNDQTNYNEHEVLNNPGGGFVVRLPFWGETVFGLSAYQSFDYNVVWRLYDFPNAYNDIQSLPSDQFRCDLDVVSFQLTAAREFMEDKLSLGIGLEFLRGDLFYKTILFYDSPLPAPYNDRPYDKIPRLSQNDGMGWGFGARAGMLYKVNEKLNVAVTAHLPFDMTIEGEAIQSFYMPELEYTPYAEGTPEYLFTSGAMIDYTADFETDLALPPSIAFGVSYDVTEKLTVAFDAEYTFWSEFEGFEFKYSNVNGLTGSEDTAQMSKDLFLQDVYAPADWSNSGKVMLGLNYKFNDYLTFMAGGSADQSPIRDNELFTPQFVDTGDKYTVSGGVILHLNQWDIGFSQCYTHSPDLTTSMLADYNGDGIVDNFAGDYKANTYETVLSFNYRF